MKYVRYTETSKTISEFRCGNTGTGDTSPLSRYSFLSAPDGRVLVCAGCGSAYNKPYHWVISCLKFGDLRRSLTVNGESLSDIFDSYGPMTDADKLKLFLETSSDNTTTIMEKAHCLDLMRDDYLAVLLSPRTPEI